jgi:hypothetical protein
MTPFWKSKRSMASGHNDSPARQERGPEINPLAKPSGEMPFRFQKPFAHMEYSMSPDERKVVDAIQARWEKEYDFYKDYAPASQGQHYDDKVFRAVDGMQRVLDARERAPWKEWKQLEANFEKAVKDVREAFSEQRKYVEESWARAKRPAREGKDRVQGSSPGTPSPAVKYGGANDSLQRELPPPSRSR